SVQDGLGRGRVHHRTAHAAAGPLLIPTHRLGYVHCVARPLSAVGRADPGDRSRRAAGPPATLSTTALDGLQILDLTRLLPGPFCTMLLADLGADVIKVEEPNGGDPARHYAPFQGDTGSLFLLINRNKRSLSVDLKSSEGREILLRLVERADVLVESFRPGVMDRLGLGYDVLSARNPRLIYATLSGFGQSGPYRDRPGHDLNYLALAGVLGYNADREGNPVV